EGDVAEITREGVRIFDRDGREVERKVHVSDVSLASLELGPYAHFMQKEIFDQARAITDTIRGRVDFSTSEVALENFEIAPEAARRLKRIYIAACGTSAHAGLVGKFLIEGIARIPT
ncbi:glutamine--fructose-6-phosphate aminotransferase, partial [Klebsiella pneumoniae]|nr:glutamine--fructose-6-phosphate aminotransferase [Klebsiella pneumoniae]